ncbi:helix-turn-helix domain-containing protein [Streptomyces sp. Qhu-G9]|uniref:PucR family transcriptional regulator n=1 Tax=Streptomyces sp. Qhu-G9 TaxID=3452799 RepID=UPI0022AC6372|nr:PucR family transcriptional regulator [Streptomyces aurantiacus]WAU83236.1 helix-turn-helix domain-containing protein [Streptomyces aurantiacus]
MDPFAAVPRALAAEITGHMRMSLEEVSEEVEREVREGVPEYSRPSDEIYVRTLRAGVVDALALFIDRIAEPGRDWGRVAHAYEEIGRGEAVEGRSLDTLQTALRLGGRVAWRRMGLLAEQLQLDSHVVAALGEAAILHMHEIAEAATAGYTEERLRNDGELARRRKRLLDLLFAESPASPEATRELAHAARWSVPRRVAVLVFDNAAQTDEEERLLLPAGVLADTDSRPARLLLPDPDRSGAWSGRPSLLALRDKPTAIGPTVPLTEARDSLRWATRALDLVRSGVLSLDMGVVRCADHLPTLLLHADEPLLRRVSRRILVPLDDVQTPQRERLAETLLAWLQSGNSVAVATRLHIHPQTVRYRLRQLEKLFGDRLRDPQSRFELELALRAGAEPGRSGGGAVDASAVPPPPRLRSAGP